MYENHKQYRKRQIRQVGASMKQADGRYKTAMETLFHSLPTEAVEFLATSKFL